MQTKRAVILTVETRREDMDYTPIVCGGIEHIENEEPIDTEFRCFKFAKDIAQKLRKAGRDIVDSKGDKALRLLPEDILNCDELTDPEITYIFLQGIRGLHKLIGMSKLTD